MSALPWSQSRLSGDNSIRISSGDVSFGTNDYAILVLPLQVNILVLPDVFLSLVKSAKQLSASPLKISEKEDANQ